jgi:NAD(P)-dependent dehydrogenase (short-subunit alcohol dehydrogenase family)
MALASIQEMDGLTLENVAAAQPIGRIGEPEEQANAVLYLCSERSTYMVGHALVVDGGTAL